MENVLEGHESKDSQTGSIVSKRILTRPALLKRALIFALFIYYLWLLTSAWAWHLHGDFINGVFWPSLPAGTLFPIPTPSGPFMAITRAYPIDAFIYLVFIYNVFWILWTSLSLLYIFSPFKIDIHNIQSLMHE